MSDKKNSNDPLKDDNYWKDKLSAEEFLVARQKGTERAFTGRYWDHTEEGVYHCVCCKEELFASKTKFDAGCGWPSYYAPIDDKKIATETDNSLSRVRTEVLCQRCGAHLGHVFDDGPNPTGLRYCINSVSLDFKKKT